MIINKIRFNPDDWLSESIGVEAYNLNESGQYSFHELIEKKSIFLTAKINANSKKIHSLEDLGFYKVNTQTTFNIDLKKEFLQFENESFTFSISEDFRNGHMFANTFIFDRFSVDGNLPKQWSYEIKKRWLSNKELGKFFLIAHHKGGDIAGFILFNTAKACTIELLSVLNDFRGMGLAKAMLVSLFNYCQKNQIFKVFVGTQNENKASIALYENSGFQFANNKFVYHYVKGLVN